MKKLILISAALFFVLTAANPLIAWSQTETKQSMNTIYEKRIYAIKVGKMGEVSSQDGRSRCQCRCSFSPMAQT